MSEKNIVGIGKLFQIGKCVIPKEVRDFLEVKDGDRVYFLRDEHDRIWLEKAPSIRKGQMGKYVVRA